jgi:hypothetical protein
MNKTYRPKQYHHQRLGRYRNHISNIRLKHSKYFETFPNYYIFTFILISFLIILYMVNKEEYRKKIINVAGQIFSRFGFKKTTMEEIANALKMGKSSIYY